MPNDKPQTTIYQEKENVECPKMVRQAIGLLFHNYMQWIHGDDMKKVLTAAYHELWEPKI